MTLRKHQRELDEACCEILAGRLSVETIIAEVTPGGGKSHLPVILAERLIQEGWADYILWIVPRNSLREQGERDFCSASNYRIRAAANGLDMRRGTVGYITTYQAIVADPEAHQRETQSGRWIVFADEPHHVAESGVWHNALEPIISRAVLRVLATGTAYRADGRPIAFFEFSEAEKLRIGYSRSDALAEGAVSPVHFVPIDGEAEWREQSGEQRSVEAISKSGNYAAAALFTALRTEFADELLQRCISDWEEHHAEYPAAKLLVVAPSIGVAKRYRARISARYNAEIATSDDSPTAQRRIRQFKGLEAPACDVLVTVAMAYEGLSVPEITHIACLTHIRSVPWLEQCFARANRRAPGKRYGVVYGPDDPKFREAIRAIESEQQVYSTSNDRDFEENGAGRATEREPGGEARPFVEPIRSGAHGDVFFGELESAPVDYTFTPSESEKILRSQIHRHIQLYLSNKRPGSIAIHQRMVNRAIRTVCEKKREEMDEQELTRVWVMVRERFPV